MNAKLYVGNLPYSTSERDLWSLFSQSGAVVSVDLIKDRISGRSKGFAFIVMSNLVEAEKAIELFNGCILDDSQIRVSFAKRREDEGDSSYPDKGKALRPLRRGREKR